MYPALQFNNINTEKRKEYDMRKNIVTMVRCLFAVIVLSGMVGCNDSCSDSCNGSSGKLTPVGTAVKLSKFASTFTGVPGSTPLSFSSLLGSDPQGNPLSGSLQMTPGSETTVLDDDTICNSSVTTVTLSQNNSTLVTENITKYFRVSDGSFYRMAAVSGRGSTTYVRTTPADSFAWEDAKVGDSGNWGVFQGSDSTALFIEWEIDPDVNGGSVFVISEQFYSAGMGMTSEKHYYYLDAEGNPIKFAFRINMSDGAYQVSGDVSGH